MCREAAAHDLRRLIRIITLDDFVSGARGKLPLFRLNGFATIQQAAITFEEQNPDLVEWFRSLKPKQRMDLGAWLARRLGSTAVEQIRTKVDECVLLTSTDNCDCSSLCPIGFFACWGYSISCGAIRTKYTYACCITGLCGRTSECLTNCNTSHACCNPPWVDSPCPCPA